ncbi:MAG TPA: histidine phosphatase family protein [Ktedonobacteraceae bacterium]|jgi:probable phosphoglycerate mutase
MTHLYLIRHGEATSQTGNILRDDGLTPLGVQQAERLRDRLMASNEIKADVLIASTLPRARQTSEIIAPALQLPIIFDDDVQELRWGEAEGLSYDEFRANFGNPDFERDPFRPIAPGGESWGQFMLRVSSALHRITQEHAGKTIVVVCHGGVIDGSFLYFFNVGTMTFPSVHFFTRNTSITYWRKDTLENKSKRWRLVRYNDEFHVRDLNAEQRIPWEVLQ